jgi:hypothetical protein
VLVSHDQNTATYLVYGHDLNQAKVVWPARNADPACPRNQLCLQPIGTGVDDGTLRILRLPVDLAKDPSSIVLQRAGHDHPFAVAVPALPAEAAAGTAAATTDPKFQDRIVVGADEGTIVGQKLDSVVSVSYGGKPLAIVAQTPTSIKISGLAAAGASAVAKTADIVLVNQAGKQTKVPLEVVSSRIEVLSK